jgi:hypothetical protein
LIGFTSTGRGTQQPESRRVVVAGDASRAPCGPVTVDDLDVVGFEDEVADGEHEPVLVEDHADAGASTPSVAALRALRDGLHLDADDGSRGVLQVLVLDSAGPASGGGAAAGTAPSAGGQREEKRATENSCVS